MLSEMQISELIELELLFSCQIKKKTFLSIGIKHLTVEVAFIITVYLYLAKVEDSVNIL